jgi:zinc protease
MTEYDRARSAYLAELEKKFNNRETTQNKELAEGYVRSFIDGTPATGIELKYQMMSMIAPQLPVEMINQTLAQMVTDDNRVVSVMLPEKEGIRVPTEAEVREVMTSVDAEDIQPFVDEVKSEPLIENLPAPGKVVSTKELPQWGATEWTLSNGVKVVVKKTDFQADEILVDAQALGGTSVYPDSYANTLIFLPQLFEIKQYGLGTYTYKDVQKYMQGKQCELKYDFDDYCRDIKGKTTPKDLKTLMELIYSYFTQFNISNDEFQALQSMMVGFLHNQESTPEFMFQSDTYKAFYGNPRKQIISVNAIENTPVDQVRQIVAEQTANAADYTFYFVGNVDPAELQTLCEQYLATLPANAATASQAPVIDGSLDRQPGDKLTTFTTPMQVPQTYVAVSEFGEMPYTAKNRALSSIAGQILTARLLATVREDMGAVYSIYAFGSMDRQAKKNVAVRSAFPMKPEMKEQVLDFIEKEYKNMESNITKEELAKVVEFMVKQANEGLQKNDTWLRNMSGAALNGVDVMNGAVELYQSITVDDVQNFMKELNAQDYRVVLLEPAAN